MFHKCDGCQFKGEHQEMGFRPIGVCKKGADLIEANKFFEAEKCPFNQIKSLCDVNAYCQKEDCDSCKIADELRKTQDFNEAKENLKQEIIEYFQPLCDSLVKAFHVICDSFQETWSKIKPYYMKMHSYPNKKVVHLALHHPKARVRKKNLNRIKKWIDRK